MPQTSNRQTTSSVRGARRPQPTTDTAVIGRWHLLRQIGQGQFTCTYEARPEGSPPDRPADYAAKLLRRTCAEDPVAVALIRREALVGSRVSHPHLISILAAHVAHPPYYLVMPRLAGESLNTTLRNGLRPVVPLALWIAHQVAEGLAALHADGWAHADVKPDNIVVSPQGHATLIDLGFARRIAISRPVAGQLFLGTMRYNAPEMFTSALRADARSDIYSLGVALYELLTGRPPFPADNPAELAEAHLRRVPPHPRSLAPQLPSSVARLLKQMLAKEPLRRPQTATELISRLAELEIETFAEWEASVEYPVGGFLVQNATR